MLRSMDTKPDLSAKPDPADWLAYQKWLDGICSLQEAAELRGVHTDTLKKEARAGRLKIVWRSAGRLGVRRRDALMLP
jgi:hypothetical protein